MSDSTLNYFVSKGTATQMAAFTPSPPTAANAPPAHGNLFINTTDGLLYLWTGAAWSAVGATTGTVTHTGTLTSDKLLVGNGSSDIKVGLAAASSKLLGSGASGSGSAYSELTLGTNLSMSGTTINASGGTGAVAQIKSTVTGAVNTGTTAIPTDDTIPQNTEGDEYMTLAITPTNSSNKLRIDVTVFGTASASNKWNQVALFQDSTADALAVGGNFQTLATAGMPVTFSYVMTAGTTSCTTFKVRAGTQGSATYTFNGQSGGRLFGGVLASSIIITEYTP